MCRPVKCSVCKKTTWAGCGSHIAAVKARVPAADWCDGKHSQEEKDAAKGSGGFFSKIFGG